MEFDINKVYTAVNADEVKIGSFGYFADTLSTLKGYVIEEDYARCSHVVKILSDNAKDRFSMHNGYDYSLFYLLKEPKENKEKYRPYSNIEEFINDYCDRTGIKAHSLTRPLIWVKSSTDTERLITEYATADNAVRLGGHEGFWYELNDLFEQYTYLDGSKCGIKER